MVRRIKDPVARIEALIATAEAEFRREFLVMVQAMRQEISMTRLISMLESGRMDQALQMLEAAAAKMGVVWSRVFTRAGYDTAVHINRYVPVIDFSYDQTNTAAVEAMKRNRLRLIRGFTDQQRRTTRQALTAGIEQGLNPREQALLFRDSIGLTPYQESVVRNYRRQLQEGDPGALERQLRDRRFDGSARRAIDGEKLPKSQIDKMVSRYRERMIAARAETIARTESMRAVHEGVFDTYQQAVDAGVIRPEDLIRTWNTASDGRVRHSHQTMDGQQRGFDEPFVTGNGARLMYPTDPGGPAEDTINCRCTVAVTMNVDGADLADIRVEIQGA